MAEYEYVCKMPFWIDTDAYSDRDRQMFVCGAEFMLLITELEVLAGVGPLSGIERVIHKENESRARMACGRMRLQCEFKSEDDTWTTFMAHAPQ